MKNTRRYGVSVIISLVVVWFAVPQSTRAQGDDEQARRERAEYRMTPRLRANGALPVPNILLTELQAYRAAHTSGSELSPQSLNPAWRPLGPAAFEHSDDPVGGTGRVSVIRFAPNDTNTIYVGTPDGGLWRSQDAGQSWRPLTDDIPSLGVSDIAIDPNKPSTIYIATGDAKVPGMYGDPYSYGILNSTDAGVTWNATGFALDITQQVSIPRLVISPANSNVLLAAVYGGTNRGIQKSTDGGATWVVKNNGSIYDIEYNPADPNVVYASGYGNFRRSTDGGDTWTNVSANMPTWVGNAVSRTAIAVTRADPNIVYVLYVSHGKDQIHSLYRSTDRGLTFERMLDSSQGLPCGQYGEYNLALSVSPLNPDFLVMGEQFLAFSTDAGRSWSSTGSDIHPDNHAFVFAPHSDMVCYSGNDGGIYRSDDGAQSFVDLSAGLGITQFYRLGMSSTRGTLLYAGAQDNGISREDGMVWDHVMSGADGAECAVERGNEQVAYAEFQHGFLERSDNGGLSFFMIAPANNGNWITPIATSPRDPKTLFAAYQKIYRSSDRGNHWDSISPVLVPGDPLKSMAIAPSDEQRIYTGTYRKLFRTTNGGSTWLDITAGSPASDTAALTYIAVSPTNPNKVWLTFSGFTNHQHVYNTTNAGTTWTNYTGTLPNVPVNTIVCEQGTADGVYIGTDIGVFYRDAIMNDWQLYSAALPNVSVSELEVNEASGRIFAATFGRGIWQAPFKDLTPPGAPQLIAPANDSASTPLQLTYAWHPTIRTTGYRLEIARDMAFSQIVASRDTIADTTFTPAAALAPGTKYYWHVLSENDAGASAPSDVRSFMTKSVQGVAPSAMDVASAIAVYPNPATNEIEVRVVGGDPAAPGVGGALHAELYDALGRVAMPGQDVRSTSLQNGFTLDVSGLPEGVYDLRVSGTGGGASRRVVIIR